MEWFGLVICLPFGLFAGAVGVAMGALQHHELRFARWCFWAFAILVGGGLMPSLLSSAQPLPIRIVAAALVGAFVFGGTVGGIGWINKKAKELGPAAAAPAATLPRRDPTPPASGGLPSEPSPKTPPIPPSGQSLSEPAPVARHRKLGVEQPQAASVIRVVTKGEPLPAKPPPETPNDAAPAAPTTAPTPSPDDDVVRVAAMADCPPDSQKFYADSFSGGGVGISAPKGVKLCIVGSTFNTDGDNIQIRPDGQ